MSRPPDVRRGALDGTPRGSDLAQEIDLAENIPICQPGQAWAARRIAERFALSVAHAGAVVDHRRPDQGIRPPAQLPEGHGQASLHIEHTVEAEAMPAHILRGIVRDELEALLPPDALKVAKVAEDSERKFLNALAYELRGRAT